MNLIIGRRGTRGLRVDVNPLVFVNFSPESAFILNLSECGMAIQAMEVLEPGRSMDFSFALPETNSEVQGMAKVVWSDRSGRAGLKFEHLSEFDRLNLTRWVLSKTDMVN